MRRIARHAASDFALPVTSHCPSLRIARHFALPVTSHYPSLRITRHFALPVTSHYPSLRIPRHFALPVTSHYPSLRIGLRIARHFALRVTPYCDHPRHEDNSVLRSNMPSQQLTTAIDSPYDLQIQVAGGYSEGSFELCITSLVPMSD